MATETEKYLVNKLEEEIKEAQGSEDGVSKVLFNIHTRFENVKSSLEKAKNGDDESSRREDLYYLLNALENWQMVLKRKNAYSPERIRFVVALRDELNKMESRLRKKPTSGEEPTNGEKPTNGEERENVDGQDESYNRWSYRTVDRNRVFGFSEKENFMERFLIRRDNEVNGFKAICISGVAGVGKTTLCQLAFNNQQVTNSFFPRIWVCMSQSPQDSVNADYKKEVLKRMLECLGVENHVIEFTDKKRELLGLLFALRSVLKGRRYLIVLDDALDIPDFFDKVGLDPELEDDCTEKLALGLPKRQGGAVIVTTGSEELAKRMVGEENVYPLLPLKDESCWEILKDSGGEEVMKFLNNHDLEDTVMSKLGGLPLAAKIMGEIIKEELDHLY